MKQSMEKLKESHGNFEKSVERARVDLERKEQKYHKLVDDLEFFELQIATAEKERKDGFDPDKYLVNRR